MLYFLYPCFTKRKLKYGCCIYKFLTCRCVRAKAFQRPYVASHQIMNLSLFYPMNVLVDLDSSGPNTYSA